MNKKNSIIKRCFRFLKSNIQSINHLYNIENIMNGKLNIYIYRNKGHTLIKDLSIYKLNKQQQNLNLFHIQVRHQKKYYLKLT